MFRYRVKNDIVNPNVNDKVTHTRIVQKGFIGFNSNDIDRTMFDMVQIGIIEITKVTNLNLFRVDSNEINK